MVFVQHNYKTAKYRNVPRRGLDAWMCEKYGRKTQEVEGVLVNDYDGDLQSKGCA